MATSLELLFEYGSKTWKMDFEWLLGNGSKEGENHSISSEDSCDSIDSDGSAVERVISLQLRAVASSSIVRVDLQSSQHCFDVVVESGQFVVEGSSAVEVSNSMLSPVSVNGRRPRDISSI